ncbi:hypothetical protein VI817_000167 [Penicillium citrinum]|nr:hypothetical protein VI817_000167 [Penicillium citrinum]
MPDPGGPVSIPDLFSQNTTEFEFKPGVVYKFSSSDTERYVTRLLETFQQHGFPIEGTCVEAFHFCLKSKRFFMQKRASESTSKPGVGEGMGGAKEPSDETHKYATLRETLEESGILLLRAQLFAESFFYIWRHEDRNTGRWKWLVKCAFVFIIPQRDAWLFDNRIWNTESKEPVGQSPTLFDPKEVSDTFSVTEMDLENMLIWSPEHHDQARDPKLLVVQKQTYIIMEYMFRRLPSLDEPDENTNRICYAERCPKSDKILLKLDGETVPSSCLEKEGLLELVHGAMKR